MSNGSIRTGAFIKNIHAFVTLPTGMIIRLLPLPDIHFKVVVTQAGKPVQSVARKGSALIKWDDYYSQRCLVPPPRQTLMCPSLIVFTQLSNVGLDYFMFGGYCVYICFLTANSQRFTHAPSMNCISP